MQDKTTIGISDTFREFIEALAEEVVINGEPFDAQKKWLRKYSEAEGLNYETVESNMNELFDAIKELEEHESVSTERFTRNLAQSCYFSEAEVDKLIEYAATKRAQSETERMAEEEAERKVQEAAERIEQERLAAERKAEEKAREERERKAIEKARRKEIKAEEEQKAVEEAERNRQQLIERNRIPVKIILISLGVVSLLDIIFLRWWCVIPLIFNAYMALVAHEKCGQGAFGYEKLVFKGGALVVILFFASFLHWWSLLLIFPAIYFIIGKDEDIWDLD